MNAFDIASALEDIASRHGFTPPQAFFITGEFNLTDAEGQSVYSDEAHLWCEDCANKLLAKALPLMPEDERINHFPSMTDAENEDTQPHCMACGETLAGSISASCVNDEIEHYKANPIGPHDTINDRQAVGIAAMLYAAQTDPEVIAIGMAALRAYANETLREAGIPEGVFDLPEPVAAPQPWPELPLTPLRTTLQKAEAFISGFEDDDEQEGVTELLADLRGELSGMTLATDDQIEAARDEYQDDDITIDNDALVSVADDAYWVAAWVRVAVDGETDDES